MIATRGRTREWPCAAIAIAIALGAASMGCQHAGPYPAPPSRSVAQLDRAVPDGEDVGDVARMRALEAACRIRLSGQSAAASIAALDRVHEVLGSSCDLETIDHDPLHWRLRCRSDALFDSGQYALSAKPTACAELGNRRVSSWSCVGAVLAGWLDPKRPGSLSSMDAAVLGHVDMRPLRPQSESHVCSQLQQSLDYAPQPAWSAVPAEATEEERLYANNQLAWCRAASVAEAIRVGMRGDTGAGDTGAVPALSLAVLGVGTSWLGSQPGGACPSTGKTPAQQKDCVDARRVDLLLHFTPRSEATASSCDRTGDDAHTALHCLQQCLESEAVGRRTASDAPTQAAPLFLQADPPSSDGLPPGWYLKELTVSGGRTLDMARVCVVLGIDAPHCPAR